MLHNEDDEHVTPDEIRDALESLDNEETASKRRLAALAGKRPAILAEVESVAKRFGRLDAFRENLQQVRTRIRDTSALAEDISSKVRQLDKVRGRVSECQKRVQDLLDLQLCSEGVRKAMRDDKPERAAAHVHRYLSIDQTKLLCTADDMAQDCSMVAGALKHLQDATERLRDTVSERFDRASADGDAAAAQRYFKLFPLLGMHVAGLEKYAEYLGRALRTSADANLKAVEDGASAGGNRASVMFADGLTYVFEEVAKTIEAHQPLVETHYGPDHAFRFLSLLQRHCDAFGDGLLRAFRARRDIDELLKTMRASLSSSASASDVANDADAKTLDPKDVDLLVEEIVLILSRYDLYGKFVMKRIGNDDATAAAESAAACRSMLDDSLLCRCAQELMGTYLELERYYMEESLRKAMAMDTIEGDGDGDDALTSTMVDDVFFIVRKCAMRSLRTASLDVLCAVVNYAVNALEADMCAFFGRALAAGYPGGTGYFNRFAPDADRAKRALFIAALNNTDVAAEYTKSLSLSFREEMPPKLELLLGAECKLDKLDGCLHDFGRVTASLAAANKAGFRQLHGSLVEPRVHAWMEPFYEQRYAMDETEFARAEVDNPFVQTFVLNVDALFREFRAKLTPNNYYALVVAVASECAAQLERAVLKTEFNRLGGMALDKVVRTLISYFGTASAWSVRERFARLVQVTAVLNLERVSDLNEFLSPDSGIRFTWKLTPDAIKQILKLRVDFREDDIRQIKL